MSKVLDYGMTAGTAMSAPRTHHRASRSSAPACVAGPAAVGYRSEPAPDIVAGVDPGYDDWRDRCDARGCIFLNPAA